MANKTPVRVVFDSSNVATGLAEMQSGETVGPTHGGTGLATLGTAGHVLRMNAGGTAIEFAALEDLADITSIGSTLTAPSNADFQITTAGTGNIVLNDISISDNSIRANRTNDDLVLQGSGSGAVSIKGAYVFPNADGSGGQFLKTDGAGTLSFANLSLGDLSIIGSTITTPSNADFILDPSGSGVVVANGGLKIGTGATVTGILDEDALVSNSATSLATQQSIKAYVDSTVTLQDLDVASDSGTAAVDLDSQSLTVTGGTGIGTTATGQAVTVNIDATVVTLGGSQTLINKTLTAPTITSPIITGVATTTSLTTNDIRSNGSNADINITPQGTGSTVITSSSVAYTFPTSDGSAGDFMKTDGAGNLSFGTSEVTASDDSRVTVKNNKAVSGTARTIDFFQASGADMVWYFMALTDLTNDHSSASVFTVCHNNNDAFAGGPRGGASGSANSLPSSSADIASGQVRVKIAGPSADGKISFYKIPISRANTADETSGVTITTSNTDVDSGTQSIDTFPHLTQRAAKYTILVDDNAKTETGVTEALVVHDGTNAFIIQYGTVSTGNNDMITLSAAISGSNVVVSAAGLASNLSLKIHKTLLSDSMTAATNNNQKIIGATTVSSTATAFDSIDVDDASAALYYIMGKNPAEGTFSVQEVYLTGAPGEAGVSQGPFVSSKETTQLEFTSAYLTTTDNSVGLNISSTSGSSTVVNAYRINCLAE